MKKIFVMLVALIGFGLKVTAQTTATCYVEGKSDAYVSVSTVLRSSGSSIQIIVEAHGMDGESGVVRVQVEYEDYGGEFQSVTRMVRFNKIGKGNSSIHFGGQARVKSITGTRIMGAPCYSG
jgi:hypothetical protein